MRIETSLPTADALNALRARITRPLVLVGMMGVGKSTVGKRLAEALRLPFHDADEEIIAAAQMPIADIFDRYGEAHFRDGERRVIARLLEAEPSVIATGGGAFVEPETQALIIEKGITIWLDSDIDTLVNRVSRNNKRPLLRGKDTRQIVSQMKGEREPFYQRAAIHVSSDNGPHAATVMRILKGIEQWL